MPKIPILRRPAARVPIAERDICYRIIKVMNESDLYLVFNNWEGGGLVVFGPMSLAHAEGFRLGTQADDNLTLGLAGCYRGIEKTIEFAQHMDPSWDPLDLQATPESRFSLAVNEPPSL